MVSIISSRVEAKVKIILQIRKPRGNKKDQRTKEFLGVNLLPSPYSNISLAPNYLALAPISDVLLLHLLPL